MGETKARSTSPTCQVCVDRFRCCCPSSEFAADECLQLLKTGLQCQPRSTVQWLLKLFVILGVANRMDCVSGFVFSPSVESPRQSPHQQRPLAFATSKASSSKDHSTSSSSSSFSSSSNRDSLVMSNVRASSSAIPWFVDEATALQQQLPLSKSASSNRKNQYRTTERRSPSTVIETERRFVLGPSLESKPDYESIVGPLGRTVDDWFAAMFRKALVQHSGCDDSALPGYAGLMDITRRMNALYTQETVQKRAERVLLELFPPWMPSNYARLFSKPFPAFASRMNAWATWVVGTWLMGGCEIIDVDLPVAVDQTGGVDAQLTPANGAAVASSTATSPLSAFAMMEGGREGVGKRQGVRIQRCRFLEEAGCASVCVNSCKIPTQRFFQEHMGLALLIEPNYDTFECQFSFGKSPTEDTEQQALSTPCLSRCPSERRIRQLHKTATTSTVLISASPDETAPMCDLMIAP